MRSVSSTTEVVARAAHAEVQKVIVTWQDPRTRALAPVGVLSFDGHLYRFQYLARTKSLEGFRPLLGLPDLDALYEAQQLFPLFAQRAMDPKRPDFERWVRDLDLDDEPSPWEQVVRSGGMREGDTIQLFPVPKFLDGAWHCHFLVHGMRYMLEKAVTFDGNQAGKYDPKTFEQMLSELDVGAELKLVHEEGNAYNDLAMLVLKEGQLPIGYVPDLLLSDLASSFANGNVSATVQRVNPPESGWHMRVLARLRADLGEDFEFFAAPEWAVASA